MSTAPVTAPSSKPSRAKKDKERKLSQPQQGERLKTVVRRLPPNLPEDIFWQSVQQWVTEETSTWRMYYPGKLRKKYAGYSYFNRSTKFNQGTGLIRRIFLPVLTLHSRTRNNSPCSVVNMMVMSSGIRQVISRFIGSQRAKLILHYRRRRISSCRRVCSLS